uniref:Uncharacterized protein n=1 Tax=Naja naja TaxID=35670 RepID=A0A8C6YB75_NAJNA
LQFSFGLRTSLDLKDKDWSQNYYFTTPATSRAQGFATTPAPLRTSKQDIRLPPSSKQSERSCFGSRRNRPLYKTSTADLFCPLVLFLCKQLL